MTPPSAKPKQRASARRSTRGAVATGDPQTTHAAAEVLRAGGNAVDAAIAACLASFVAEPLLASPGGSGVMVIRTALGDHVAVDFFSHAPHHDFRADGAASRLRRGSEDKVEGASPTPRGTLDFHAAEVDFGSAKQVFHIGRGSAAAPRALSGLVAASAFGSMPLRTLIEPAASLATDGAKLTPETAMVFRLLRPIVAREAATAATFLCGASGQDGLLQAGDRLCLPDLAELFHAFAEEQAPPRHFHEAILAEFSPDRGGVITEADLDFLVEPKRVEARQLKLFPPQASAQRGATEALIRTPKLVVSPRLGGTLVHAIAQDILSLDLPREASLTERMQALSEACRRGTEHKMNLPLASDEASHLGGTTHISVIDAEGCAVSVTLTNGEGCGTVLPGLQVQLNNFLGESDLNPAGFFRHAPGAPLQTMVAPTLLLDGDSIVAAGSGGSNRIRSVVAQVVAALCRGSSLETAILSPRVHAELKEAWFEAPGDVLDDASWRALDRALLMESGFSKSWQFPSRAFFFGGVHSVKLNASGQLGAFADPRRGGVASIVSR